MAKNNGPRVAWWSPLPPQRCGISDYSFELLTELTKHIDLVAVVRDDVVDEVRAPEGVPVVAASAYSAGAAGACDLDVYQMGNHPWFHGYLHEAALRTPGLLVLHDPSLLDFYTVACANLASPVLLEEARIDDPTIVKSIPTILVDGREEPDRLRVLLSKRLIEANLLTVVHSGWVRDQLAERYPGMPIRYVHPPARVPAPTSLMSDEASGDVVFGLFGSLERHKRLGVALEAFASVHRSFPRIRLVIAGHSGDGVEERRARERIRDLDLGDAVHVLTDVTIEQFEAEIARCDVVVSLRWPTAGEFSGSVVKGLGAGKPVIVSDVPQYRDLDPAFCWKVPVDSAEEASTLERLMRRVVEDPEIARIAGAAASRFVDTEATVSLVAQRYLEAIEESRALRAAKASRARAFTSTQRDLPGVNVIADWQVTTGLAESARRSVAALVEAGMNVSVQEYLIQGHPREGQPTPTWMHGLPRGRPHDIDICYLNVNELSVMSDAELRPRGRKSYIIGFWFWELPSLSRACAEQIERVDEIWVGSNFTREAMLGHTDKPILVMPCVVTAPVSTGATRRDLGLPEDACIFFFHFDSFSSFARKNPWAAIRAYRAAFTPEERAGPVRLVMKTRHLSRIPSVGADRLQRELHEVGGSLIDLELSPEGMASLITCSDVYISLHRSEGFGLGIAEAMLLGRPAIATAYSGNMDFMTQYNSCLVGYGIHPVDEFELSYNPGMELVYEPGQLWAEPNVDHATRWMRWLYENPEQRQQIGAAGSATIRAQYSPAAAAAAAAARLEQIAADAPHRAARQAVAAAHRAQIAAEAASRAGARRARQSA